MKTHLKRIHPETWALLEEQKKKKNDAFEENARGKYPQDETQSGTVKILI